MRFISALSLRARPARRGRASSAALAASVIVAAVLACSPDPVGGLLPDSDLKPPLVLEAGPEGARSFLLRFDEEVRPLAGRFALEPGPRPASASAEGRLLRVGFESDLEPGSDYAVSGEVEDAAGNATRFVFRFAGWNGRPARLRLSEAQTAKNSSASRPHRDYLELEVAEAGNLGGIELSWASSNKRMSYRFPGIEVGAGERVVLHLAPEGIAAEKDEAGADLAASGGIDATPCGRDLWCSAGVLPDENGVVALRSRPGAPVYDGLFYADESRAGALGDNQLSALAAELGAAWPVAGVAGGEAAPAWEDAFRWRPSTARSLCRSSDNAATGSRAWYLGAAGSQSPGAVNAPPPPE